jgi:hypothetical protein
MNMNHMPQQYLQPMIDGGHFPSQVAYGYLLEDSRFDFSAASLDQIDLVLDSIRTTESPVRFSAEGFMRSAR